MVGQTCNADLPGGYWKDTCVEIDYGMLTTVLGIRPEEITLWKMCGWEQGIW